jgi:DNA-binding transcriptional MocR family regulator
MLDPLDGNGESAWDAELIAATIAQTAPRLAYLIPDFQNPTGALMDQGTRERIVRVARSSNTLLLIDESFRDVPFPNHPPLPPRMAALDGTGLRVLSLGSLSKSIWGGLRIGWIRAAPALINRLAAARALGDMSGPVVDQLIAARFLSDPHRSFDLQRRRLADGAAVLTAAIAEALPEWRMSRPTGGASLWVALPGPFASELARLAPSVGVRIVPGPRFGPDGTMESYLRVPFTQPPDKLITGVRRLASVASQAARARSSEMPGWLA